MVFFKIGVKIASLKLDGMIAPFNYIFMIFEITGESNGTGCCFRIQVGIGSRLQDFVLADFIICRTSSWFGQM